MFLLISKLVWPPDPSAGRPVTNAGQCGRWVGVRSSGRRAWLRQGRDSGGGPRSGGGDEVGAGEIGALEQQRQVAGFRQGIGRAVAAVQTGWVAAFAEAQEGITGEMSQGEVVRDDLDA